MTDPREPSTLPLKTRHCHAVSTDNVTEGAVALETQSSWVVELSLPPSCMRLAASHWHRGSAQALFLEFLRRH